MPYSTTINTFRFSLVLGFITLVACGGVEEVALPINEAPMASSVSITYDQTGTGTGNAMVGDSLTGNYVYADTENDAEGVSIYRWFRNDTIIGGATTWTYTLVVADIAQPITFEVTPVATTGTTTGSAVSSSDITADSAPVAHAGADQTALSGDTVTLDGSASFYVDVDGDGLTYSWSLTTKPAGSQAILTGPTTVKPTFDIDISGDYVVQLIVNDGAKDSAPDTVIISTINSAPVANAGADQTALSGDTVTLDGSASSDVDGDGLTYSWSLITKPANSTAALSDSTSAHPIFAIDVSGDYVAQLIVNDGTVDSDPDTVTVSTNNSPPVANAGADQKAFFGDTVTLNGSASSDVDGDGLTYRWSLNTKPPGSQAILTGPTTVKPTFDIDVSGDYVVQLIVNDGTVSSAPNTVITSTINSAPVANAGADQAAFFGNTVTLIGSGSSDVDGDRLKYSWSFTTKPPGSQAKLTGSTTVKPTFAIDVSGDYMVQLIVNDGTVKGAPDAVNISTKNTAPVANAGADQQAFFGNTVTLNGSGSSDVDGDGLTYSWSFTSRPTGSRAKLTGSTTVKPTFAIDVWGDYVVQLIVNDGTVKSAPNTVSTSTINSAPVANAGADQAAFFGETVTLNGSASSDVDGDGLKYSWSFTTKPHGSRAKLTGSTKVKPTFAIDVSGDYMVQLIVNDGTVKSAPDTVVISTKNTAPVANAGGDKTTLFGDTVILDGNTSSDVDDDMLTYRWSLTKKPPGSQAILSNSTSANPIFAIDVSGDYVVQLIVNDGTVNSAPDTVTISTKNTAPVANAGVDQKPQVGDTVTLDGSASFDVDDDTLTYRWSFTLRPKRSKASLSDSTAVSPTFVLDRRGDYVLQLIVNDGTVNSKPNTVTVTTN